MAAEIQWSECKMMLAKGSSYLFISRTIRSELSCQRRDALAPWKVAPQKC